MCIKYKMLAIITLVFFMVNSYAAVDQNQAKEIADDYAAAISAATAVIGGLQKAINSSSVSKEQVADSAILSAFHANFHKNTNEVFDLKAAGIIGEYRSHLQRAVLEVIDENRSDILQGGQDAFVPAYFRAQVLAKLNNSMVNRIRGAVTNRESDLINSDSAPDIVFEGSPLAGKIIELVNRGEAETVNEVIAGHYMSYRPMKLKDSCVACHARNGVVQTEGEFGGALLVDIILK